MSDCVEWTICVYLFGGDDNKTGGVSTRRPALPHHAPTCAYDTPQAPSTPFKGPIRIMVICSVFRVTSRLARRGLTTHCCGRALYSTEQNPRFYTKKHEWVSVSDNIGTVGISNYAQDALGEVVYVQLPEVGKDIAAGEECGALESVKAASEVYSPVSGKVTEKNTNVESKPALINKSCYSEGWLFRVKLSSPEELQQLMDQATYDKFLEEH